MSDDADTQNDGLEPDAAAEPLEGKNKPDSAGGDGGDDDVVDAAEVARLRKELADVRKEAAANRVKLKKHEDSQLSEHQRLEQERNQAQARADQLQAETRDLHAQVVAAKLGVRPEAAGVVSKLLDWDSIDDSSDAKQVERAVRDLLKEHSYLSGRPDGLDGGSSRNRDGQAASMSDLIRRAAGR